MAEEGLADSEEGEGRGGELGKRWEEKENRSMYKKDINLPVNGKSIIFFFQPPEKNKRKIKNINAAVTLRINKQIKNEYLWH